MPLLGATLVLLADVGWGMPLDLTQRPPDISVSAITISYTDATDTFYATGIPQFYDPDGNPVQHPITGGSYTLTAIINSLGVITSASLTITGSTQDKDHNPVSGTLLTASGTPDLLFGFNPDANDPAKPWLPDPITEFPARFEFMMSVSGGLLARDFGGVGVPMGIIMNCPNGGFDGDFVGDFTISLNVVADNFSMAPEPTSISILAASALGLAARRARSRLRARRARAA